MLSVSAFLCAGAILSGCAKDEPVAGDNKKNTQPRKKIKVATNDFNKIPSGEGTLENNRWTKWINENSPVEVEYISVPFNESDQKYNTMFAASDAPDIILEVFSPKRNTYYAQKQLLPMGDFIEKHSSHYKQYLSKYPELRKATTKADGKVYEIGSVRPFYANQVVYIRMDWLKKLKLDVPATTDDLMKVVRAFAKEDPDGNGKDDTYGISISGATSAMFGNVGWILKDGQMVYDFDRAKAYTEFRKILFDEGLIDKDYLTDSSGVKAEQAWVNGKLGIWTGNVFPRWFEVHKALKKNNPNAEATTIPLPKSPFGQFSPVTILPLFTPVAVNAQTKDPEAVMQFIDFMFQESTQMTLNFGFEGVHYKLDANGCPKPISLEKMNQEVNWNLSLREFAGPPSWIFAKGCDKFKYQLDPKDPLQKEFIDIIESAEKNYLSKERPMPWFTHTNLFPAFPKDLVVVNNNATKAVEDIWTKAIVSGNQYSVDQAYKDATNAWNQASGKKVEDWYRQWYQENKDKWVFTPELYKFVEVK
jgi:putative aldouronate transport system substrate-binding protein